MITIWRRTTGPVNQAPGGYISSWTFSPLGSTGSPGTGLYSLKVNALSDDIHHSPLAVGGAPGIGVFLGSGQLEMTNNSAQKVALGIAVTPGNTYLLSTWWGAAGGNSHTVRFDVYDGLVNINSGGTLVIPGGVTLVTPTALLDQTQAPDVAAVTAGLPSVTGTSGSNPDSNATDGNGSSVPYVTFLAGVVPSHSIISVVVYKTDGSDVSTYTVLDSILIQSPDPIPPPLGRGSIQCAAGLAAM